MGGTIEPTTAVTDLALRHDWQGLGPGTVPIGFSEEVLAIIQTMAELEALWNSAAMFAGLAQKWNGHGAEKRELKAAQMFCEIELGQLLGPNPGQGTRTDLNFAHAQSSELPPERVKDFRRFYGWRDALIEAVRGGKLSRRALLLLVDEWEAGERAEPVVSDLEIRHGDFRDVLVDVEPSSVALVLTDPPYPTEYLPLWSALGEWSAKHLSDGSSLVAYCGQSIMPQALSRLAEHLRYWWTIALIHGQSQMLPGKWVSVGWKPLLWFVRERRIGQTMLADTVSGGTPRKTVPTGDDGSWAQSVEALAPIISALTAPGDLVVDPFSGSGTVGLAAHRYGRRFIGAEIASGEVST